MSEPITTDNLAEHVERAQADLAAERKSEADARRKKALASAADEGRKSVGGSGPSHKSPFTHGKSR